MLVAQSDVGDIGPPQLIDRGQHHVPRQARIRLARVAGIGSDHELALAHAQQVILAQQPIDALRIHLPAAMAQFGGDPWTPASGIPSSLP